MRATITEYAWNSCGMVQKATLEITFLYVAFAVAHVGVRHTQADHPRATRWIPPSTLKKKFNIRYENGHLEFVFRILGMVVALFARMQSIRGAKRKMLGPRSHPELITEDRMEGFDEEMQKVLFELFNRMKTWRTIRVNYTSHCNQLPRTAISAF